MQDLDRNIKVWTRLDHQYVLCLHGTVTGFGPFRALVSPWMQNGTLNSYLARPHETLTTMGKLHIASFSFDADYGSSLFLKA
jgi:hypothetical protein